MGLKLGLKYPWSLFLIVPWTHFPTCRSLVLVWPARSFRSVIALSHHVFKVEETIMAAEREKEGKTEVVLLEDILDSAVIL